MSNTDFDKLAATLKFKKQEVRYGYATVRAKVEEAFLNGVDIAHGGFLFSLADYAAALASNTDDITAISANSSINFLTPCPLGAEVLATAETCFKNAKNSLCDVAISSPDKSVVYAVFQSRFIVRKPVC